MSEAYAIISVEYGVRTTKRSGVPLINHIDEGLIILDYIGADRTVMDAYCLHPLLQSDENFVSNIYHGFQGVDTESIILACEYRRVANSFLSNMEVKDFVGFTCSEIKQMLIADKVQNYKDFMYYHYGKHENSDRLYEYFHQWFGLLDIDKEKLKEFIKLIQ